MVFLALKPIHTFHFFVLLMNRDLHDSPAGAFFGQDVRELGASTALHCGIGDVHVDKAGDLGHITKSILHYHHVVASTWGAHDMNRLVCMAFSSEIEILQFFEPAAAISALLSTYHICFSGRAATRSTAALLLP